VTLSEFREDFDAGKTRMIGLPYGEKTVTICMFSSFDTIPACYGQADRQNCYINMARQCAD